MNVRAKTSAPLARYARAASMRTSSRCRKWTAKSAARRVFEGYSFLLHGAPPRAEHRLRDSPGHPLIAVAGTSTPLSLNSRVRRGAELILYPNEAREIRLLAVHLKSGCGRRTLDSGRDQCTVLAQQVPILEQWIDAQAAAGRRFAVLGDFNRDLLDDRGPRTHRQRRIAQSLWAEIDERRTGGSRPRQRGRRRAIQQLLGESEFWRFHRSHRAVARPCGPTGCPDRSIASPGTRQMRCVES